MAPFEVKLKNKPENIDSNAAKGKEQKIESLVEETKVSERAGANDTVVHTKQEEAAPDPRGAKYMSGWSTDKIVATGLVVMGIMSITGYIAYALYTGNSNGTEIPMAIVSGLTGFLGRGAVTPDHHNVIIAQPQQQPPQPMVQQKGGVPNGYNEACPNR